MYIKKLVGSKCYLSPIDINDAEKYARWVNDQELANYLSFASSNIGIEKEKTILTKLSAEHNYGIVDIKNDELIGNIGLMNVDHINRSSSIGIFIGNKEYWSNGYGTESMQLLIDYAYKKLNLHNIMLNVYSFNERALKCYEKIGFKKVGELRESCLRNRKFHNIIILDITPEDFYVKNVKFC